MLNGDAARKIVQEQTLNYIQAHPKLKVSAAVLEKPELSFFDSIILMGKTRDNRSVKISVIEKDCLEVAREIVAKGRQVAVLNMANQFRMGGAYKEGAASQEEDLFRRTNLVSSLREDLYPQDEKLPYEARGFGEFNTVYSEQVTVLRKGCDQDYAFFDEKEQFSISVISSAAYNLNYSKIKKDPEEYLKGMERKIIMQLETALKHRHRRLVLSAFGCGVFGNEPKTVAALYKKVLGYPRYQSAFDEVIFAIIPNPGCTKDNYAPFKEILSPTPTFFQKIKNALYDFIKFPMKHPKVLGLGAFAAMTSCCGIFWGLAISLALTMALQIRNMAHDRFERNFTKDHPKILEVVGLESPFADGLKAGNSYLDYFKSYANIKDWKHYSEFAAGLEHAYKDNRKKTMH